jgi:hypothetical protein
MRRASRVDSPVVSASAPTCLCSNPPLRNRPIAVEMPVRSREQYVGFWQNGSSNTWRVNDRKVANPAVPSSMKT